MQDRLNVDERFVLKDKNSNLNAVCVIKSGSNEFKLTIITIMNAADFKTRSDQFVLEI